MDEPRVRPENFMRGAMIITLAALISRVLGMIYRPVAQLYLGDQGLALVTPPSNAYQLILAISSVGLNVAISRLVSERLALQDYRGARYVFRVSTGILVVSGFTFSVLFGLGARWMAAVQGYPEAWPGFLVLSPAILLVTLECAFRGLYQGMQQMRPSAVSQVVEQAGRVLLGLTAVGLLSRVALNFGAAGFNLGNTIGVLLGALYGFWIYTKDKPTSDWTTTAPGVASLDGESVWTLAARIFSIAVPLSLIGAVLPLMGQVDSSIVTLRLQGIGLAENSAKELFAQLVNAGQLRDLPSILTMALYVSLVPAITEAVSTGRLDQARYRAATALRITLLAAIPATAGLLFGARAAYEIIFLGNGYILMGPLAWSTLFLMVQQTSSGILQGAGLIWVSVRNILAGVVLKTVLTYWWVGIPTLNAEGAAYATAVGFALAAGLNLWSLHRSIGLGISLKEDLARPFIATAVMSVVLLAVNPVVHHFVHWNRLAGLIIIGVGALVYLVAIFAVGGIKEADLHLIPGVTVGMIGWLRRVRLLRD